MTVRAWQETISSRTKAPPALVGVFTALWALAHIGHVLRKASPGDPVAWIWLVAALALLVRPGAQLRIAALALAQLLYLASKLPLTDNHAYIMGFVDLGLLSALLLQRRGGFRLPLGYLRATLLISYGAAALAKLNTGFFDPAASCAVEMFYDAARAVGVMPGTVPGLEPLLPYGIAFVELLVPVSLLVPATRCAGVVLVVVFHWAMSLSPTATALDFTLVLFALVFLFLPRAAATEVRARFEEVRARLPQFARGGILLVAALITFVAVSFVTGWGGPADNPSWVWLMLTAVALGALLITLAVDLDTSGAPETPSSRRRTPLGVAPYAALLLLQLLNGGAPYLGLKTVGSYIMYSNLRTEMGQSNHFFLPRLPVETGLDDFVEIVESSNPTLRQAMRRGDRVSWHELRRHLAWDPGASVSYRRDGALHVHERASENPVLVSRNLLLHKLIGHRPYDPLGVPCRW